MLESNGALKEFGLPSAALLILRTALVIGIGLVPMYGVVALEWDVLMLLALFFYEGLIALLMDILRVSRVRTSSKAKAGQLLSMWRWLAGIHFFAAFCLLLFLGPKGGPAIEWFDWIAKQFEEHSTQLAWPLLFAFVYQLAGLLDDFTHKRVRTTAGSYAVLLFFAPFLSLAFAWAGQPEFAALLGITACRMLGQLLMVWLVPISYRMHIS